MGLFMKPVYGVDGGQLVFEFAKSRGAIHFHSLLTAKHAVFGNNAKHLQHLSENIHNAMATVNDFIRKNYDPQLHKEKFPICPELENSSKAGKITRQKFCKSTSGGAEVWEEYLRLKDEHTNTPLQTGIPQSLGVAICLPARREFFLPARTFVTLLQQRTYLLCFLLCTLVLLGTCADISSESSISLLEKVQQQE